MMRSKDKAVSDPRKPIYRIERTQVIERPRAEVFAFFSEAGNLERITPAFLRFQILTPQPIEMRPGVILDYRLRLWGMRFKWKTRIDEFVPEQRFVDVQLVGPYRYWRHLHEFDEEDGATRIHDLVEYQVPFGPLGTVARSLLVRRSLDEIFDFRQRAVREIFPPSTESKTSASQ